LPQPTVNNFAGASAPQQDWNGQDESICIFGSSVLPHRRARSANDQSQQRL
jgi:hypothetical protein